MNKKIWIIVCVALLAIGVASAQTQSKASIEVGYLPESGYLIKAPTYTHDDFSKVFYANIDVYLSILRYGYISGEVDTGFGTVPNDGSNFFSVYGVPIVTSYKVGAGVVVGGLTVGIEHNCSHPVTPDWTTVLYGNAGYTKIFANYTVKF